ncbi:MAG: ATP-binding protein [Gemmatimonadaceae bacterium]
MPRQTKAEIEQSLLKGSAIPWADGGKRELLELHTPVRRRLFAFLLQSGVRTVKGLPDDFVRGLAQAFESDADPAKITATSNETPKVAGPWRLTRIETDGFGGINVWGGQKFIEELDGESLLIDGPNGSGKTSLVAALTWAFTGQRYRDLITDVESPGQAQVFDAKGAKIGEWPPLACYPDKVGELATSPFVEVKLTFKNPAGDEATINRILRNGQITDNVDSCLQLPPVLVETGLIMPTRLAHIRFGAGQQHLTDAVQMLTGLDEIALLGEFVGELCHKSRDYMGYSKAQQYDELMRQFSDSLSTAKEALVSIGKTMTELVPSDTRDKGGAMATLGKTLTDQAAAAVSVISTDLAPNLDLTSAAVQQRVAMAIDAAKAEMNQGLSGLPLWTTISSIATALSPEASASLAVTIAAARKRLREALELNKRAAEDPRFQLKAVAAAWHKRHHSGSVDVCPLCAQSLKNYPDLAAEIDDVGSAGEAAQRTFRDNLNAIRSDLDAAIPTSITRFRSDVFAISPKRGLEAALRARFVDAPSYATCLTGLGALVSAALLDITSQELADVAPIVADDLPQGTAGTLEAIAICDRFLSIADWATKNQAQWNQWWDDLTGLTLKPVPQDRFAGKLDKLDNAMGASIPYRHAAKGLRDAWRIGQTIDLIEVEQKRRQDIADELEPLKALRRFAESETRNAIEGLSARMVSMLDSIYITDKLKFHSTHSDKKTGVTVRGGFGPELRIDASLVANASWMRALLWSFLFAVRQEAVQQLGEDRLPLLVLDDPQATFDVAHQHRWAQYIIALQAAPTSVQVILATYDESFLAQLSSLNVSGRRAYLAAAATDTGCLSLVEGDALNRAWTKARAMGTPDAAQAFIGRARIHVETMLKVMLRGEADTRTLTLGKLRDKIKELNKSRVTPWNRRIFEDLANRLDGQPEVKHMESSHHSTGLTLGMAEAVDVEKYWWKELWPRLERAFRAIREYRLLHGESKALHADPSVVTMPEGHRAVVRRIPLEIHGRAAALSGGRLADGNLTMTEFDSRERERVVLGNHDAFRVLLPTLEPVARPGDVVLVAEHATVLAGSLVVAACGDHMLARRFQVSADHPDVAILTAQAISPSAIAPPFIAHRSTVALRKIVGVLFDPGGFSVSATPGQEIADCGGDAAVSKLVSGTLGLIQVSGGSAEPQALDGQYLLIGDAIAPDIACRSLDGRPVIASDSNGNQYFKRIRAVGSTGVVLESLHGGGDYPPVLLSAAGSASPSIDRVWPVIGVLFERP